MITLRSGAAFTATVLLHVVLAMLFIYGLLEHKITPPDAPPVLVEFMQSQPTPKTVEPQPTKPIPPQVRPQPVAAPEPTPQPTPAPTQAPEVIPVTGSGPLIIPVTGGELPSPLFMFWQDFLSLFK